jgi:broad specificity phosphatase PhoE
VTIFFLVRHGAHDLLDRVLCGRMPGVSLNAGGREQAERIGHRLSQECINLLQSSPLERACETAAPIARHTGAALELVPALNEIELGEWSGRSFEEIKAEPAWQQWNKARQVARAPGGESMLEAQQRVISHIDHVRARYPDARVVLVSHSDVLRAIILYYLGMSLDEFGRIEISPASISTVVVEEWGAKILALNEVSAS